MLLRDICVRDVCILRYIVSELFISINFPRLFSLPVLDCRARFDRKIFCITKRNLITNLVSPYDPWEILENE